jgi:hypothetical protein
MAAVELAGIPHFNLLTAKWGSLSTNNMLLSSMQHVNVLLSANERAFSCVADRLGPALSGHDGVLTEAAGEDDGRQGEGGGDGEYAEGEADDGTGRGAAIVSAGRRAGGGAV